MSDTPTSLPGPDKPAVELPSLAAPLPGQYKVRLDVFEGPLDLLLYLVRRQEVSIYDVSIEKITEQYLEYIDSMLRLDIEVAGEFMVMAASLIYIKSRELLPRDQQPPEDDAEEDDPRWELIRQLVEYKKFKEAAERLQVMETAKESLFSRQAGDPSVFFEEEIPTLAPASTVQLLKAFHRVLKKADLRGDQVREISDENFTVADKMQALLDLTEHGQSVPFTALFPAQAGRTEIVVTFLALLELIRLKQVVAEQAQVFGDIVIRGLLLPGLSNDNFSDDDPESADPEV
ncbi:MAG: segregation and condensation protein A [Verrucomicrobiales bacterium]